MDKITIGLVKIDNGNEESVFLPYSAGLLQAYYLVNGKNNANVVFLEPVFLRCPVAEATEKLACANIVFFSAYTWNFQISIAIAKKLKKKSPDTLIVFGGPEIPPPSKNDSTSIIQFLQKHPYIDIICHGEGERIATQIIDSFATRNWSDILSLSYYDENEYNIGLAVNRETHLETIPSPYLSGVFDSLLEKYPTYRWLALWETNRGCPFSCAYCAWGKVSQSSVYKFSIQRAKEELKWFSEHKIQHVFCCDSNFGMYERDVELAEYATELSQSTGYPPSISFFAAKNTNDRVVRIQAILAKAGMDASISLALQSTSPIVLKNIGRENISPKYFSELQQACAKKNINTSTDLIISLPGETYDSFVTGVETIIDSGQFNKIHFFFLSLLQNSRMITPEYVEGFGIKTTIGKLALRTENTALTEIDELQEIVISTSSLSSRDWRKLTVWAWMCSFLFFNKVLQIPLTVLKWEAKIPISEMIKAFLTSDCRFPMLSNFTGFLFNGAESIQKGGPLYYFSKDYFNMSWKYDDYLFLKTVNLDGIDSFYKECRTILEEVISKYYEDDTYKDMLDDAIILNKAMLKIPSDCSEETITLRYNLFEYYNSIKHSEPCPLQKTNTKYTILHDRTWVDWQEWIKQVVWFEGSKAEYLWSVKNTTRMSE